MVTIEHLEDGTFRVSRVFPCAASMQAGASALERVVPEAFKAGEFGVVSRDAWDALKPTPAPIELRD